MTTLNNRLACAGTISAAVLLTLLSVNAAAQGASAGAPLTPATPAAAPATPTSGATSIGNEVDDAVITTKVRAALMSNEDVKSLDIKVKTRKGEVMLSGFVDNQAQVDRGIAVAKAVEGVVSVDNQLSLKEGKQSVGNKIDDAVVTARVKSALLGDTAMKSLEVAVTTRKGVVQLSGFVDNESQLSRAMDVAKGVEGVGSVVNHMAVKK